VDRARREFADARCLAPLIALKNHPAVEMRIRAARAYRRYINDPVIEAALRELMRMATGVCALRQRRPRAIGAARLCRS